MNIKCRKCDGPHFTIKCGKNNIDKVSETSIDKVIETSIDKVIDKVTEKFVDYRSLEKSDYKSNKRENYYSKKIYRVKLAELPKNITEEELMEMTCEWGHIVKIKVINYDDTSVSYIDFSFEDEATYFIEAIDKTPLESLLLYAVRVESY